LGEVGPGGYVKDNEDKGEDLVGQHRINELAGEGLRSVQGRRLNHGGFLMGKAISSIVSAIIGILAMTGAIPEGYVDPLSNYLEQIIGGGLFIYGVWIGGKAVSGRRQLDAGDTSVTPTQD